MNGPPVPCPYRGLMPYSVEDASFLFGREVETEIVTSNLLTSRITVLYGPSGAGKTSLLNAGVKAHLWELASKHRAASGKPKFAVVTFDSWFVNPITGLANELKYYATRVLNDNAEDMMMPKSLGEMLQVWADHIGGNLLIILDQFEEYFLYHAYEQDEEGTFGFDLPRVVNRPDLPVNFLISIREDRLADLTSFMRQIPNLLGNALRLEYLSVPAARSAIEKPIELYNYITVTDKHISIEAALVEAILEQLKSLTVVVKTTREWGTRAFIEPASLQLMMESLWAEEMQYGSQVLRLETLNRLGGASQILRRTVDSTMESYFTSREKNIASDLFRVMVTPSGAKIAHTVEDLAAYTGLPIDKIRSVLDKLIFARILRTVTSPVDEMMRPRYEVFGHLVTLVVDWQLRHEKDLLQAQEKRTMLWLRLAVVGLVFFFVTTVILLTLVLRK